MVLNERKIYKLIITATNHIDLIVKAFIRGSEFERIYKDLI